ncbi:hypothetical protein VM1G_06012 [Cytospora mali]|uniref:Ecp2 effector protein domain-containing protein n=1 Tax=Cytospora mali TaxID=578113 RepID=A0A194W4E0_CYTMA|nr:hypothetical protein VM1G_06012 [Valsa mali]
MKCINPLLLVFTLVGTALGGLVASSISTVAAPSLSLRDHIDMNAARSTSSEEVDIEWYASGNPPAQICTPYGISYRDDNCYPKIADCQHIYDQYVNFSNSFCLDNPSGAVDFGTLITWNTCMIQVSLLDNSFACAAAPDIADKINTVLKSDYKSEDGKGVWTSFGSMKCPNGHYTGPVNWMEWYMGCTA